MNCKQARELLGLLLEGKLSGTEARDVRVHLASCGSCAAGLPGGQWVEVLPVLDETVEPSGDFSSRFYAQLEARPKRWRRRIGGWGWTRRLAAAGALAAAIGVGIFAVRYPFSMHDREDSVNDFAVMEKLPLLQDMAVISHLDLLEDFDTIEELPRLLNQGVKN
jgi:anti-sigma factor RsiW